MKYYQFKKIVDEIIPQLEGSRAKKAFQPDDLSVQVELYTGGQTRYLTVCTRPRLVALYLAEGRLGEKGGAASDLAMKLRSRLSGAVCTAAFQALDDRVLRLDFSTAAGKCALVIELFGVGGNLYLLDEQERVAAVMDKKAASSRGLSPGEVYSFPQPPVKLEAAGEGIADPLAQLMERENLSSYSAAAEKYYPRFAAENALERRKAALRRERTRERKRLERLVFDHRKTIAAAKEADWFRECGDILAANFQHVPKGRSQVRLPDYYADRANQLRMIALDEKLSPQQNMERYFKKSRKLKGGAEFATTNLEQIDKKLELIEWQLDGIESAADPDSLDEFVTEAGLSGKETKAGRKAKHVPQRRLPYRKFEAADGSLIMVGKGGRDNDELTFKVARGLDLWLHVSGSTGSHVVLSGPGREEFSHEALLDAAHLAVQYSSLKGEPQADVDYTRRKYVSRPPGAAPGLVTMASRKTLRVRIEPRRLERLFNTRQR